MSFINNILNKAAKAVNTEDKIFIRTAGKNSNVMTAKSGTA